MSTAPHDVRGRWLSGLGARTAPSTRPVNRGIATIELAVVVAVTLVMVAVAVSAYRTDSARREVRASLAAISSVQEFVTDAFERTGLPPDVPALDGATIRRRYVETVAIRHGRIEIRFGEGADENLRGRSLSVSPFETMDGEVTWLCGTRSPGVGLYALGLFGGTLPPTQVLTTVDRRYLPPECR